MALRKKSWRGQGTGPDSKRGSARIWLHPFFQEGVRHVTDAGYCAFPAVPQADAIPVGGEGQKPACRSRLCATLLRSNGEESALSESQGAAGQLSANSKSRTRQQAAAFSRKEGAAAGA